jgi:hypothetical protein
MVLKLGIALEISPRSQPTTIGRMVRSEMLHAAERSWSPIQAVSTFASRLFDVGGLLPSAASIILRAFMGNSLVGAVPSRVETRHNSVFVRALSKACR